MKILYQYFKRGRQGSLPNNISLSTIDAVNKEVKTIASVQSDDISKMQGEYIKLMTKDRATIEGIRCKEWDCSSYPSF